MKRFVMFVLVVAFSAMFVSACGDDWAPENSNQTTDAGTNPNIDKVPVECYGLYLKFAREKVAEMVSCLGWSSTGKFVPLQTASVVNGAKGVCAIVCYRADGTSILPDQVSGIWDPVNDRETSRWYKPGCHRLPGHPPNEPNAGGAWDGLCAD